MKIFTLLLVLSQAYRLRLLMISGLGGTDDVTGVTDSGPAVAKSSGDKGVSFGLAILRYGGVNNRIFNLES